MRYKFVPDNPEEEKALKSSPSALPIFDPFLPPVQARSIMAGTRLGVFKAIGQGSYTPAQLAEKLSLNPDALELLLRVLACAGYVARKGDRYCLTELTRNTLLPESQFQLSGWMEYSYIQWKIIERLEEVLKTGKGIGVRESIGKPKNWGIHQQAMLETARPAASLVASLVPIKEGAKKMLDIGGAHGLYGAMICRKHPPMRSEVLDLPEAVEYARKLAQKEGIDDVVTHQACDVLNDDLGQGYDAVFLGSINHHFTPDQNLKLLHRIKKTLTKNGTVAIWEFKRPDPAAEPDLIGDGLALFFRITSAAQCYTSSDYVSWIKSTGFIEVKVHLTPFSPSQILVSCRVP